MIEIISVKDIKDATPEELANLRRKGLLPAEETRRISGRPLSPYERPAPNHRAGILLDMLFRNGFLRFFQPLACLLL